MPSLPLTPEEEARVLKEIGVQSVDDLFASIPPSIRENAAIDFGDKCPPEGLSEFELREYFSKLAEKNFHSKAHFLGGGIYDNIQPAIVDQLALRGEFLTAYTPYQPEVSQGTLQAIFEFQSLISRITQMEVANASLYDGATATAEAILMAGRIARGKKKHVLLAESLNPDYDKVIRTYLMAQSEGIQTVPWNSSGMLDLEALENKLKDTDPYAFVVPTPNFFGIMENVEEIKKRLPDDCLFIAAVSDPSSLALYEPPSSYGANVTVGEAHQFGTPMLFGGPHVGFFATEKKFLRQLPGRLAGETVDNRGNRAYALTLSTREQHIRREKATSNICTNQGLIALRTTIYLSALGKQGFINLGERNHSLFAYLKDELNSQGIRSLYKDCEEYREGVFEVPNLDQRFDKCVEQGIVPGIKLKDKFPHKKDAFENALLICVSPKHDKATLDKLVDNLKND